MWIFDTFFALFRPFLYVQIVIDKRKAGNPIGKISSDAKLHLVHWTISFVPTQITPHFDEKAPNLFLENLKIILILHTVIFGLIYGQILNFNQFYFLANFDNFWPIQTIFRPFLDHSFSKLCNNPHNTQCDIWTY